MYTFTHTVPAKATGHVRNRRRSAAHRNRSSPEPPSQQSIQYGAPNKVVYFSVDGSPVAHAAHGSAVSQLQPMPRSLQLHGTLRNNTEYCVMCHNPSNTDASTRASATVAADKAAPPQGINFNLLVHRIHYGINMQAVNRTYIVVGFGGSHNDFSGTLFPALSPTGAATDTGNCSLCHVNGSEQNSARRANAVVDPQGPINPIQPISSACTGCHVDLPTASTRCPTPRHSGKPAQYATLLVPPMRRPGACAVLTRVLLFACAAFLRWRRRRQACAAAVPAALRRFGNMPDLPRGYLQGLRQEPAPSRGDGDNEAWIQGAGPASPATGPARSTPSRLRPPTFGIPRKLAAAAADKICLTCHLNQPTQIGRFQSSHMKDQVACTSCHKIHANGPDMTWWCARPPPSTSSARAVT